jgi:undecaprenyl-diphosphatase
MSETLRELATAVGLGIVQGVTEFLPISSDGHLALFGLLFEVPEASLTTTVLLHVGTLLATLFVFRADLLHLARHVLGSLSTPQMLLQTQEGKLLTCIVVASIPTAVIGLLLRDVVEPLSLEPWAVGLGFLGSAAAVVSSRRRAGGGDALTLRSAFVVGILQGLAVLPGLSRAASKASIRSARFANPRKPPLGSATAGVWTWNS